MNRIVFLAEGLVEPGIHKHGNLIESAALLWHSPWHAVVLTHVLKDSRIASAFRLGG